MPTAVSFSGPVTAVPFEAVYRQYVRYVAAIATRMIGPDEDVHDIVQDVFLAAAQHLRSIDDPKAWLAVVTSRKVTDRRRSWWSRAREQDDVALDRLVAGGLDPADRVELRALCGVLSTLPRPVREAWTLRYVRGLELEEVAVETGCSLATAKRRINAGRRALLAACRPDDVVSGEA